ncbi:uncharacterized protein V6R79_007140 [Siganus canaliculatus]
MGASSSGLLDEAKVTGIKGLVDSKFQSFSVFYRQQYSSTYVQHLHQEVEPKKEGRGLLLTQRPQFPPEEVLYQGYVKFSCWDEQGKKCKERYIILRRDYKVEIHENMETFNRGCAPKLVLQTAGGRVFTTEEDSRAHLEQTCAAVLNDAKEDSSSSLSTQDLFAVYLHLPYRGHTCFLFQKEEERGHFLSALKKCIRHCDLDPWCDPSYESQAFIRALQLYQQDKGCYESWEILLGTKEKVLTSQVMEEVLPWLQSQLQARVKGKKTERIRQWLATVQATYILVSEQLTANLEALREECHQTASANQTTIRSNLDQIMSSLSFLEDKVRDCISKEAEQVCSESVSPYITSILEALTDNISAGIQQMQRTLQTKIDSAFAHTNGGTGETKNVLSTLRSISLDQCYKQVENLTEKLEGLQQRFGLSSTQRLVHSTQLEMEKLLDSAVYTLELFLQSSSKLQPSQIPVKMERAKERVLKQLDYDSRVVQRRLYQEALLQITLPALTRQMDSKRKTELQQFEQYIFADYSSFILVQNVYDEILRKILSKEIETVVQDAASKKSNNLSLDTSDLAISQYSLLGQTPPISAPDSPAVQARDSSPAAPSEEPAPAVGDGGQKVASDITLQSEAEPSSEVKSVSSATDISEQSKTLQSPVIIVTQQLDNSSPKEEQLGNDAPLASPAVEAPRAATPGSDTGDILLDTSTDSDCIHTIPASPDVSLSSLLGSEPADVSAECGQSDYSETPEIPATPDPPTSDEATEDAASVQNPPESISPTESGLKISLGSLSEAISCSSDASSVVAPETTDRAVYLTGAVKDNWEVERVKEEKQKETAEEKECEEVHEVEEGVETEEGKGEPLEGDRPEGQKGDDTQTSSEPMDDAGQPTECPEESAATSAESEEKVEDEGKSCQPETESRKEDVEEAEKREDHEDKEGTKDEDKEDEDPQNYQPAESQPADAAELPLDCVSMIRELVTEITEVETIIRPCPESSSTSCNDD